MKIKNVLIVGSSGFIGNELRENISKEHKVYLIDKKIHKNAKNTNHKFIKYDLYSKKKISYLPNKIDTIFFFAGVTGGENSYKIDEIKKYFKNNIETLFCFLKLLGKKKIKKIIFTSTEHVYGDDKKKISKIYDHEPNPKNYYGLSKLICEKILYNYYIRTKISVDILRFPRVISNHNNNIILNMINSSVENKKIKIKKIKTHFNFVYIEDLIKVILVCDKQSNTNFRILNFFSNDNPITLLQLANYIKSIFKGKLKIVYLKNNKIKFNHNPFYLKVSNKELKKQLYLRKFYNLKQIIKKLIDQNGFKKYFN